jgi:hypothetical protein
VSGSEADAALARLCDTIRGYERNGDITKREAAEMIERAHALRDEARRAASLERARKAWLS